MSRFVKAVRQFFSREDGPASVEYAVMIALIAVVVMVGARAMGTSVSDVFHEFVAEMEKVKGKLNGDGNGGGLGSDSGTDPGGG